MSTNTNVPSKAALSAMMEAGDAARMLKPSQRVVLHNTSEQQTHHMPVRSGYVTLLPGERKECEMLVDEIAEHRHRMRADRGYYPIGSHNAGKPLPPHPVRILDIPEISGEQP